MVVVVIIIIIIITTTTRNITINRWTIPQEAKVNRMVAAHKAKEDSYIRKGFLPFLQHEDLKTTRKRELLHKACVGHSDWKLKSKCSLVISVSC